MNTSRLFLILLTATFYAATVRAEDRPRYRVQVKVSASDNAKNEVTSFLKRELRKIGDIDLVETDPTMIISVVALAISNRSGVPTGYCLSVVVEKPVPYRQIRDEYAKAFDPNIIPLMDTVFDNTTRLSSHFAGVCGPEELEFECKQVIANIDGSVFEDTRKFVQQITDLQKSQAKLAK